MSSQDRVQILRMVSEGKVTPEEADELMGAVDGPVKQPTYVMAGPTSPPPPPALAPTSRRKLLIQVNEDGEQRVRICIPLALARAAGKLIPAQAQRYLADREVNLEELLEGLVNINEDGVLVQINDDDSEVRIAVE